MEVLTVSTDTIADLLEKSWDSSRKRALHLLRSSEDGTIPAIMYNALQPGTYVQPHRHPQDGREIWISQMGLIRAFLFDENGKVREAYDLGMGKGRVPFIEIPGNTFHTAVALHPDSVMCELYCGRYNPKTYKEFATWAPPETNPSSKEAGPGQHYLRRLELEYFKSGSAP